MSRSLGSRSVTTRPPMDTSPCVMGSRPATMRSKVDLPQPDGPTSATNSPSRMCRSMPWITSVRPKLLRTSERRTSAIELHFLQCLLSFESGVREPFDELFLRHHENDE